MIAQPKFEHGSFQLYPLVRAALSPRELAIATCVVNGIQPKTAFKLLKMHATTGYYNIHNLYRKFEVPQTSFDNCITLAVVMSKLSEWHDSTIEEREVAA